MNNHLRVLGSVSPYCKNGHNCPGYLLQRNGAGILLDCGPGVTSRMDMPGDLQNLTIVISHFHKDHYADLFSVGYASYCYHRMGRLSDKIKVYLPKVNPGEQGYADYCMIRDLKEQYFDISVYDEQSKITVGDTLLRFFLTKHSVTNYSVRAENPDGVMVYTGDMGFSNVNQFAAFSSGASLLICEATYLEQDHVVDENHLRAREAACIASLAMVDTLMLTHFWPEHEKKDYVNEARSIFGNTVAADEKEAWNLIAGEGCKLEV